MARKMYSCDFETTTKLDDCRVWSYGWMEIGNNNNYKIGTSIEEFMDWVKHIQADLFFHNLRFDGEFIVNWLLKNGFTHNTNGQANTFNTIISNMGQWYMVDICYGYKGNKKLHTVIYDSLKKLPFPVKQIAKDFKMYLKKGEIDYHKERPIGYQLDDEENAYVKNDVEIIADALKIQYEQGLDRMTSGSDSLKGFKSIISTKNFDKLFPVVSLEMDKELRKAYRGGFTWLNEKYVGKEVGEGIVLDVNSQYPAQMYYRPLPYGMPIYFEGKYETDEKYPLHIQCIDCEFYLKEGYIPMIQIKKQVMRFKETEYLKDSGGENVELFLTNIDMELFFEHYDVYNITYVNGWKFKEKTGIFNQFIDKWMFIKSNNEGAIRIMAKLMLNSLYGKFASNPKVTGKIPYLKENGACGYTLPKDSEGNVVDEYKKPIYTPMGLFITSWARYTTITTAQKCFDRIIYCDTDSIHLEGMGIPDNLKDEIDDNKLGFWAHESTFKRAKYIRQKTYAYDIYVKEVEKDGKKVLKPCSKEESTTVKFSVKCAGMSDGVKKFVTFDNFKVGFKSSIGKLKPVHVSGGVVLVDTDFTIK